MTIKYHIILFLSVLILVSCESSSFISGKLEGVQKNDLKVYLIQPESFNDIAASYFGKVVDSAAVNSNGEFEFYNAPKVNEPVLFELAIKVSGQASNYLQTANPLESNFMPVYWQPGETLQITSTVDAFQKDFSIAQPSDINKALMQLRDVNQKAYATFLANKHWDVEDGVQLLEKEHAILEYQTRLMNFADSTPFLVPAMVAVRWISPVSDYERVPEFIVRQYDKWSEQYEQHPWVKQLCQEIADLPVLVGDEFPNLELPTLNKDTLYLHDQLGEKLTIVDLWASWCGPCRVENRDVLLPLWDKHESDGLQIIAYALEIDESSWRAAAEKDGADHWLQTSDLKGDYDTPFLNSVRVRTIPANFILDDKGIVIAKNVHGEALKKLVENLLGK